MATTDASADALTYQFYRDSYGGAVGAEAFAEVLPAALRCVRKLTGAAVPDSSDTVARTAYLRAVCAALDAFAEFGEGRVGGYAIGEFKVTNYMEKGTTGEEVAQAAALGELAGTGLSFSGVA
jgi:hypothetical protein